MIHHQHFLAGARPLVHFNTRLGNGLVAVPNGIEQGRGLEARLCFLGVRVRLEQQCRTGAHLGNAVADAHGAQRQAGVHVAVEADEAHGAAVPAARRMLVILDELDGVLLRCPRYRDRPGVGEKSIEGVEVLAQCPFHVVHRVNEARVELELPAADNAHAARHADSRLVVSIDVSAHGEFRFFFFGVQQLQYLRRVSNGILAAGDGAGDGAGLDAPAVDTYVHFR